MVRSTFNRVAFRSTRKKTTNLMLSLPNWRMPLSVTLALWNAAKKLTPQLIWFLVSALSSVFLLTIWCPHLMRNEDQGWFSADNRVSALPAIPYSLPHSSNGLRSYGFPGYQLLCLSAMRRYSWAWVHEILRPLCPTPGLEKLQEPPHCLMHSPVINEFSFEK